MNARDKYILGLGMILAIFGVISTIFWSLRLGLIALVLMYLLVLLLLVLQKNQMAKVQQRVLSLIQLDREAKRNVAASERKDLAAEKRLVGLLQAQQMSLDMLKNELTEIARDRRL